jgi:hypothetical protein
VSNLRGGWYDDPTDSTPPVNQDNPHWPTPERKQYALLHHAAAFARQCEAAGLPEARIDGASALEWSDKELLIRVWWNYAGAARFRALFTLKAPLEGTFVVGDPLPDALVQAIRATEAK